MGVSSSTEQVPAELREAESSAASTGALPHLKNVFSILSDPQTNSIPRDSLQQCFDIKFENIVCETAEPPAEFSSLLNHLGSSIVDLFFLAEKGGVSWIEFLRGYTKCCGRSSASVSLNTVSRVYAMTLTKAGLPAKLEFESDDADCKMSGSLFPADLMMLLWICWVMSCDYRSRKLSMEKADLYLPDIDHLVLSAVAFCSESNGDVDIKKCNILGMNVQIPAGKIHMWALKTVPYLADSFGEFVYARLRNAIADERQHNLESSSSSVGDHSSIRKSNAYLLTRGRAWAISLTLRSTLYEEILKVCFPCHVDEPDEILIYRSSLHGRGLNRFWSNVEGYQGSLLLLIAASSGDAHEGSKDVDRWVIGALSHQGFENKDIFYGTSGSLYALSPIFQMYSSSGKEKNFVYSHLHPTGRVYEPHPKPVGIGFGGSVGNERIFIDEDFAKVTLRHHAVDKTYLPGSLCPSQGFLPLEAVVLEVEVWGLSGQTAKEIQNVHKKREDLFAEQRRKVDLKAFGNWEDSPEKMMMDMVTNPNSVRREER